MPAEPPKLGGTNAPALEGYGADDDESRIVIVPVKGERELNLVGRLRYAVTVDEMRLKMAYADHSRRLVLEPLDRTGHVLAAFARGRVVGTVRGNLLAQSDIGHYYESYAIGQFPAGVRALLSITTRLAIDRAYRGGGLFMRLADAMYRHYLQEGVTVDVIDCRKPLVTYFFRLGYRVHKPDLEHPEFGDVAVLYLAVEDEPHLRAIRSPFLDTLLDFRRSTAESMNVADSPPEALSVAGPKQKPLK